MATRGVAPPPPVVRVPLLEPTPTSVTAARSLWGKPPALPSTGSILTDHYQTAHPGRVLESVACAETAILDSAARMAHIEELLRSVHKHCDAPTRETAAVAGALPQSECTKAKCRTPIGTSLEQREDQRHRGKGIRPPSPRPPRRDESPAKPGWNRRTPTPRKKPVVSDPVTEPRRVTRSSSADNPRRPQQEGLKRVGSTGSDAHTQRVSGKSYAAPSESVRRPSNRSAPSNSRASSVVVSLARKAEGTTTLDSVGREPSVIDSRLDFMQSALRDAQERATRAEARCEELEVAFHALKLQHDEATTRLEERQSQLVAQVQYLLQWVRQLEEAILVKGEVLLTKTECVDGAGVARGSQNRCVTEEANSGSLLAPGGTRGKPVHQETGAKGVTLRVPPTPPMALRLQHKGVLGRRTFLRTRLRRNIYIPSSTIRIVFMTQEHGSEESTLNALRTALSSGKADSIRTLDENAVLLHHKQAVPELLQLCNSVGGSHSMSLLNTAWKLLLSVAALKDVTAGLYCKILHFMLSQLQHHIFSHDWSDPKQIKLTTFVASYLVSTVRKHPSFAVRDEAFVNSILDLHITTVFTLVTTENGEAAQQLQKQVGVRLLGTLGALGGTLGEQQVGEDGGWSPLLVKCLRTAPSEVATSLGDEVDVDSITAVAAMTAMLAMARSMVPLLEKPASLERLLEVSLLWLPDMTVVLVEQDSGACALHKRVSQLAKELPREVYYAGRGHEVEAMESSQELDLGAQLMLLLRSTVRRSVQLDQQDGNLEKNGSGFMCGVLQRFRVFSILLAALLVPNDTSAARVLLVWEAALHALPGALRRTLGEELLLLGEGQLCALRRSHTLQHDKVETLRRFLNLLAVLTAEICRLLRVPPEVLTGTRNDSTVGSVPPEGPTFHRMVSILYHQSRVYQWWWEEMLVLSGNERAAGAAVSATPPGTAVSALHDELQSAFSHNEGDQKQRLCMVLTSVPGKLVEILRQCNHTSGSRSINVVPLFSVATRAIEALYNSADSSHDVRVCARFVAAEIVAVAGLLQCGDSAYSTLLHRLVQISFKPLESGSDLHGSRLSGEPADRSQCVEGILRYHAAVCLYLFAQRETSVPVAELCPGGSVATALRQILEGKGLTTGGDVTMHSCEALLAPQVTVWQMLFPHLGRVPTSETKAIKGGSQGSQLTVDASSDSSHCSSQSTPGRLLLPLQKCEETLRLFLESQESVGRSLTREETETLTRVEQLVAAAAVMLRPDIKSNGQGRFVSSEGPSGPF